MFNIDPAWNTFIWGMLIVLAMIALVGIGWVIGMFRSDRADAAGPPSPPDHFENDKHPYHCRADACNYDMLGTIANGNRQCPECGSEFPYFTQADIQVARALMITNRVPTRYFTYHLYEPVTRESRTAYHYARSVLADNDESANFAAKTLYGPRAAVLKAFDRGESGLLVPPVLIPSRPIDGLCLRNDFSDWVLTATPYPVTVPTPTPAVNG